MNIDTDAVGSMTEAKQDLSPIPRNSEEGSEAVLINNNLARYLSVGIESSLENDMTDDEKIDIVAARILKKYKSAFLELAKK